MKEPIPGSIIVFGSGETSPTGRKIFDRLFRTLPESPRVALLETPAGFEVNSDLVIAKVADFFEQKLQNYDPQVSIIPARKKGTYYSPDNAEILAPLLEADVIFLGPGSPTYAVRQLKDSLAWKYILARHRLGATLVLASSAVIAASTFALPVYEIYKVGEDLHWKPGLDFFGDYSVPLVFIPHWNNNDGGADLDTSRCFMGQKRFGKLMGMLPEGIAVLGVDEKTSLWIDPGSSECRVMGLGRVTILHAGHGHSSEEDLQDTELQEIVQGRKVHFHRFGDKEVFPLQFCFPMEIPQGGAGLDEKIWERAVHEENRSLPDIPPQSVLDLVEEREAARKRKDWDEADRLRERISELGWQVSDTPSGPEVEKTP